ncbi:hypothetical protein OEZ86_007794 [Tetradesmus obliquus]|nr:hypothetical protein OEZ86_007794 [Tetradesmus obliquus]
MRIFCWNVNSLVPTVRNINLKYGSLEAFFKHLDADIVCMQEVKLPQQKLTKELVVVPGYQSYWACSEGKTGYSGVSTWAREACAAVSAEADTLLAEGCEREGRALITDHGAFVLFNVYVPNAGDRTARARLPAKLAFLQALQERVDALLGSGRQVIAVGDFNIAAEPRDVHSAISWDTLYAESELQALQQLIQTLDDSWRRLHPQQEGVYTVWDEKTSARAFNVGLRIDYALCSKQLLDHLQSSDAKGRAAPSKQAGKKSSGSSKKQQQQQQQQQQQGQKQASLHAFLAKPQC